MASKYTNFRLHDPALVNLADHGHRSGLNTRAEVEADIAMELAAMDEARLEREAAEAITDTPECIGGVALNDDEEPRVVFLNNPGFGW